MNSCQHGVAEGKEFGIDAGEHGLAAVVAVSQGELQQVQQVLWEAGGGQQVKLYNATGQEIFAFQQKSFHQVQKVVLSSKNTVPVHFSQELRWTYSVSQ